MLIVLAAYLLLLVPTVQRQGLAFDEQTDLNITHVYLNKPYGPLVGTHIDASQARLPMATVAVVFWITQRDSLTLARLVTCVAGLLTLVGVYIFCRLRLTHVTGIAAAVMLAISPFFLSFARIGWTESDVYVACMLIWLLVALEQLRNRLRMGWAAVAGVLLGLTLSAKITALAMLPAIWCGVFLAARARPAADESNRATADHGTTDLTPAQRRARRAPYQAVLAMAALILGGGWLVRTTPPDQGSLLLLRYLLVLVGWVAVLAWCYRRRGLALAPIPLALVMTSLALLTFLVLPPEHLTNPRILAALQDRYDQEMAYDPGFVLEAAALHLLSIFIKSTPVLGAGLLVGAAWAAVSWRRQPAFQLPLLVAGCYFGALLMLPLAQTFYTIPLLPILSIFAADGLVQLHRRRPQVALTLTALAAVVCAHDIARSYPDYNLTGYHWVGTRMLAGRPSIGAQSVVQTTTDGLAQSLDWLEANAAPGQRVEAYLLAWHIVGAKAPSPAYHLRDGLGNRGAIEPDYVLTTINVMIPQTWWADAPAETIYRPPYDAAWLESNYEKAFAVTRAYGIEVATVWRRSTP